MSIATLHHRRRHIFDYFIVDLGALRPLDRFLVAVLPRFVVKLTRQLVDLVAIVKREAKAALAANLVEAELAEQLARKLKIICRESFGLFQKVASTHTRRGISPRTMAGKLSRLAG